MTRIVILTALAILLLSPIGFAQLYDAQQTLPPFGSYHGSDFDVVALQTGNLHSHIPLITSPQRGKSLSSSFIFDTSSWTIVWVPTPTPTDPKAGRYALKLVDENGWRLSSPFVWGASSSSTTLSCPTQTYTVYPNWTVTDPEGAKHPLPLVTGIVGTTPCVQVNSGLATDGSGIFATYSPSSGLMTLILKDGTVIGSAREDSNGNQATSTSDTLNRSLISTTTGPTVTYTTPLGKSISGPQYTLYTITDTNGNAAVYREDYQALDIQTSFVEQAAPISRALGCWGAKLRYPIATLTNSRM